MGTWCQEDFQDLAKIQQFQNENKCLKKEIYKVEA